jgi:hypothetical protein
MFGRERFEFGRGEQEFGAGGRVGVVNRRPNGTSGNDRLPIRRNACHKARKACHKTANAGHNPTKSHDNRPNINDKPCLTQNSAILMSQTPSVVATAVPDSRRELDLKVGI